MELLFVLCYSRSKLQVILLSCDQSRTVWMAKTDELENVAFVINFQGDISLPEVRFQCHSKRYANLQPLARPYKGSEIFSFFR